MIKRSESKSKFSSRRRSDQAKKKRHLKMEGLEDRRLLAVLTEPPTSPAAELPVYTQNRNVGTVQAIQFIETEMVNEAGLNDERTNADFINLGTGPGQEDTVDIIGGLPISSQISNTTGFSADIDTFELDLRGGDILDIATTGAAQGISVVDSNGSLIMASDVLIGGISPPLQSVGNANATVVIPNDGRYFVTLSSRPLDSSVNYRAGLRVYRPTSESLAINDTQIMYLDFAGAIIDNNVFNDALAQANPGLPVGGVTRVRSLNDSLPILGLQLGDTAAADRIIDLTVSEMVRIYEDLARTGDNGDIESPNAQPGDYGIRILNSRDHAGTVDFDDPRVSRLLIGGTGVDFGVAGIFGIANSVDIGNFDLNEFGIFALDAFAQFAQTVPISPARSQVDFIGTFLGGVAAHEAGHILGMIHTENSNTINTVSDAGGTAISINNLASLGPDGIFGTQDDVQPIFRDDFFQAGEVPDLDGFAINRVTNALAHGLSSGRISSGLTGRVFADANSDGSGNGDVGLANITVFVDANNNGVLDPGESRTVTDGNGNFTIQSASPQQNVIIVVPDGFSPTTATVIAGNLPLEFGLRSDFVNVDGTAFVDNNGNGFKDVADAGLEGVYIYIDLDGDNRPDLFEPSTKTRADGTYSLKFPGPGTYTIRDVVPPGFEQSFPASGEHTVVFDGVSLNGDFDFGLLPSQDFGDAPNSYGTLLAADGARHGITAGLRMGDAVDREIDGQPTNASNGDDLDFAGDDEDGVRLLAPLGPGAASMFGVTVTNTAGQPAYLKGFVDFNRDGDFNDAGEALPEITITNGTVDTEVQVPVTVPANALPGPTVARFRLSQTTGVGPKGFVTAGEVEDHSIVILNQAEIANDDVFDVSRNALSVPLNVLANDFETAENPLLIDSLDTISDDTDGIVSISNDRKRVLYTPPNGFIGRDEFRYTVVDQFNNRSTARVVVNVNFQSLVPIAVDDSFEVPEGSVSRALNVLDNDIPSLQGGVSIISVTSGDAGGRLTIGGGGQSVRYTPAPGFNGTEQFTYSIQDSAGSTSTAQVTVDLLPGSRTENQQDPNFDKIDFDIETLDTVNRLPISNVQVGDEFLVRVSVNDRRAFANPEGVASAFLDLLYTDELVSTVSSNTDPNFPFDISFGPLFSGNGVLQSGDAQVPGLINEVGGLQRIDSLQTHSAPAELFTLRMRAVSPGIAIFKGDPADAAVSETILLGSDVALTPRELRLGREELLIVPDTNNFPSAIDDSFPDGFDSDNIEITAATPQRHVLRVLDNDNFGDSGSIREFGIVTNPTLGSVQIETNGTSDPSDDFLTYQPNANVNGLEQFSYVIVTEDGVRSTAEVTISLGNQDETADVAYDFQLVRGDGSGTSITPAMVGIGDRIGLQIRATDLRANPTFVFAGFLDVLYTSKVVTPSNDNLGDAFDFDVTFGPGYLSNPNIDATAVRPGIIDEVGSVIASTGANGNNGGVLATVFFDVIGNGTVRFAGSPADSQPFSDTLLFNVDDAVPASDIRFNELEFRIGPQQNTFLRQDVNNDGNVTPMDALMVINELTRSTAEAEQTGGNARLASFYPDVNGDLNISALDALQVINYLQQQSVSQLPAAEQIVKVENGGSSEGASDQVFGALSETEDAKVIDTGVQADAASNGSIAIAANDGQGKQDEEDDILDLLADDVAGIWG